MGDAPAELSTTLLKNYLSLLIQESKIPAYICLYAEGVKLVCQECEITELFNSIEKLGTKIIVCKTCLSFYNLLGKSAAGTVGTMADIIDIQHNCTKIINL